MIGGLDMMNTNQTADIEYTVETIEKNLYLPFHLDELSTKVGISKYHLLRLFKSITDKSLMSYVKGRRLSLSLQDLINTDSNILDIALKYQFGYEQSYIRAFQNHFHNTPAKYRKTKCEMPITQKFDMHTLQNMGGGFVIQPKMVIRPKTYVLGIKEEIFHKENLTKFTTNKLAMRFHNDYLPLIPNKIHENIYLALIIYSNNPIISNTYLPCVETKTLNKETPPFCHYTIPSQEYAVFRYVGLHSPMEVTYATLLELRNYIDGYWKTHTCFKQTHPFHFEQMDLSICSDTYCEMDIYFPIST
jgi:AraC family transcriptional regulator